MDAHTPQTTPSGKLHGMPLACLLGHGDPRLTAIAGGARLDPRRVCLVGVRSFETGEAALLRRLGVRVFFMHEVARRGLAAVMKDAVAIARGRRRPYGISLDLDALDPRDAPGVGTPGAARHPGRRAAACVVAVPRAIPRSRAWKSSNTTRTATGAAQPPAWWAMLIRALLAPRTLHPVAPAPETSNDDCYGSNPWPSTRGVAVTPSVKERGSSG